MDDSVFQKLYDTLAGGGIAEFACGGESYLIQQENNKGWDYLSIWSIGSSVVCLGRVLFDIFDGLAEETLFELLRQPCLDGRSFIDRLPEIDIRL